MGAPQDGCRIVAYGFVLLRNLLAQRRRRLQLLPDYRLEALVPQSGREVGLIVKHYSIMNHIYAYLSISNK